MTMAEDWLSSHVKRIREKKEVEEEETKMAMMETCPLEAEQSLTYSPTLF